MRCPKHGIEVGPDGRCSACNRRRWLAVLAAAAALAALAIVTVTLWKPGQPSRSQVQEALQATRIVMFSTSVCPVCDKARAFFAKAGLSYVERDIEHDDKARAELLSRSGATSVPTFEIDGEMLKPGWSKRMVTSALAKRVEQRLGVKGVRIPAP